MVLHRCSSFSHAISSPILHPILPRAFSSTYIIHSLQKNTIINRILQILQISFASTVQVDQAPGTAAQVP
jgi:hypothetical protein